MIIVGYAPGTYDLFHVGHLNLLRRAGAMCDYLIAGVVSDELCLQVKGTRPVIPLEERLEIVGAVDVVDAVYVEVVPDNLVAWRELYFDRLFKGSGWRDTPRGQQLEERFAGVGVDVVYVPSIPHTTSRLALLALQQHLAGLGQV